MKGCFILVLLGLGACTGGGERGGENGGLGVTEESPPYTEWSLNSTPVARIGAIGGPAESQFSRIAYAGRLSDGRLVVVDGASLELRWFGPDGDFLFRAGGRGEGPSEFERIVAATLTPRDSVVLYDARNQRLTWFGPGGVLAHTLRAELPGRVTLIPLADSRLLISQERPVTNIGGAEYNHSRDSVLVMIAAATSSTLDPFMRRSGREVATWVRYVDGTPTATQQMDLPFGHSTLVGAANGRIIMIENGQTEMTLFDQEGELIRLARRTDVDSPSVSSSLRSEYVRRSVQRATERGVPEHIAQTGAEGLLGLVPEGQQVPPFDRMLTDAVSGRVWVRDYLYDWDADKPQRWTVHAANGQVVAQVTTPAGFDVMQVGPRHFVGVERDDVDVEYVVAYSIR